MSLYYIEDNSQENLASTEISSVASTSTTTSNKKSCIWNYCEDLRPDGWKCIVRKENGETCNQYFPMNVTKGSTTNTISHLLSQHGIVNPKAANKVFMIKFKIVKYYNCNLFKYNILTFYITHTTIVCECKHGGNSSKCK